MLSLEKLARKGANPYLRPIGAVLSWLAPQLPCAAVSRNTKFPDLQVGKWHWQKALKAGRSPQQALSGGVACTWQQKACAEAACALPAFPPAPWAAARAAP